MTLKPILAALLLVASTTPAGAQRVAAPAHAELLLVEVRDSAGNAIPRAKVMVGGVRETALTDGHGTARLFAVTTGDRIVYVTREGYAPNRRVAQFAAGETVRVALVMAPQAVELEGITATSWGRSMRLRDNGFYHRQRMGMGAFMTGDEIDRIRPLRIPELFRRMRGFVVMPAPNNSAHDVVYSSRGMNGFSSCAPEVFVDGAKLSRGARDQVDILELVRPEAVEGIEGYSSPATIPVEYNAMGSACGVILIWTRGGPRSETPG
jgi:hypothetical protein